MNLLLGITVLLFTTCHADIVLHEEGYLKLVNKDNQTLIDGGVASESVYDPVSRYLYVVGSSATVLNIVSLENVQNPRIIKTFVFDSSTFGFPQDVQICRNVVENAALLAISFGEFDPRRTGHVVFYEPYKLGDTALKPKFGPDVRIAVGHDPDNIKFTSDCKKLVVSNEGRPANILNQLIDPEGSVTILTIDLTEANRPASTTVKFTVFDTQEATWLAQGVRWMVRTIPGTATKNPFSNNIEPEYIAISENDQFAYVTLQENNAIARIGLEDGTVTIFPMGHKDFELSTIDLSDRDAAPGINMARRKVKGIYQPDKVTFIEWHNNLYLITTDEGKPFEVPGDTTIADFARAITLENSFNFPGDTNNEFLNQVLNETQIGRAFISLADNQTQEISEIYVFGGRGFSILNGGTLQREYESGDMIEKYSRWFLPDVFNGGYTGVSETPIKDKDAMSPLTGPSLSAVVTGTFQGRTVLFFSGGQNGMIYTFQVQGSVTDRIETEFQSVHRRGQTLGTWQNLYDQGNMGDIGITDLNLISEADSNIANTPILVVLSEISGSVSTYTLRDQQFPDKICSNNINYRSMNHHQRSRR